MGDLDKGFSIGVGAVVTEAGRVLLVCDDLPDRQGSWSIPSGFINSDETIEQAAEREVLEETGVEAEPVGVVAVRSKTSDDKLDGEKEGNNLFVVFAMRPVGGRLRCSSGEVKSVGYFTLEEVLANPKVPDLSRALAIKVLSEAPVRLLPADVPASSRPTYSLYL